MYDDLPPDDQLGAARSALAGAEPGSPDRTADVHRLLAVLDRAYHDAPDAGRARHLLDESIAVARDHLAYRPDDVVESGLGVDLSERYQVGGDPHDLDESIAIARRRVVAEIAVSWATDRVNLAARLLRANDDRDDAALLDEVVALLEPAVTVAGIGPDARAMLALNLAAAYSHRYDRTQDVADLRRAIALYDVVTAHPDPAEVAGSRTLLALLLLDLHRTGEDPTALDRALTEARAAATSSGSVVQRASRWHTLAQVALAAHDANRPEALATAAESVRTALELLPEGAPATGTYLATAAAVAYERYQAGHDRAFLDEAVGTATDGLALPDLDPHTHAALANQACLARTERFEVDGDRTDLDTAVDLGRTALSLVTRSDMELSLRTNLANALNQAFHLDEDSSLLIEGSVVIAPAVRRTPGGTLRAARLNTAALLKGNLARFTGSLARNREAVALGREALALTDPATQEYVIYSTNVAAWLSDRFEWTDERRDLDEAIAVLAAAQEVVTEGSPLQVRLLFTLGVHHAERYERFTSGEGWDDLQEACDLWDECLAADEPFVSVLAGKRLGDVALHIGQWEQCEKALAIALDSARRLTARRSLTGDRERAREQVQGIGALAALAACHAGHPTAAVVYLEQAAATLLADAAGHPAERVMFGQVTEAAGRLGGPLVYWAVTKAGGIALVVTADGTVVPRPLAMTAADADAVVDDVRTAFATPSEGDADPLPDWDTAATAAVTRTRELAFAPVDDLLDGVSTVGLLPLGRLAWLPFAAALDTDPREIVPRVLANARTLASPPPWPRTPRAVVRGDAGSGRRFLPAVAAEVAMVSACYDARHDPDRTESTAASAGPGRVLRRGDRPLPPPDPEPAAGLRAALGDADVAHLACHFDLDLVNPRASVLRVGRGMTLDALLHERTGHLPHLVLSACDAGLSGTRLPDEAIGPAAMLVHAGARSVVAPLWPVDDELTVAFMRSYHGWLAAGVEPATALSQTRRAARAAGAHPAIWACWTHTGP